MKVKEATKIGTELSITNTLLSKPNKTAINKGSFSITISSQEPDQNY